MRRREFIKAVAGSAAAWPFMARAQQSKVARIGVLYIGTADAESFKKELGEGLRELGYVDGQNIAFEFRSAEGRLDRLPELAAELVRLKVDVIVALYVPPSLAAKQATQNIPIVVIVGDPVETGIVPSLAHPGGNITGVSLMASALGGKSVELFRDMLPSAQRVGVLGHSTNPVFAKSMLDEVLVAGRTTDTEIEPIVMVRGPEEAESAFATMVNSKSGCRRRPGQLSDQIGDRCGDQVSVADRIDHARICRYWRADVVWSGWSCRVSAWRQVCAENTTGQAAERHTDRTAYEIRASHQPQNSEGHRPYGTGKILVACRRGARVKPYDVRYWHKADMPSCTAHVRCWGQSGHDVLHCKCLLLTQSGHSYHANERPLSGVRRHWLGPRLAHSGVAGPPDMNGRSQVPVSAGLSVVDRSDLPRVRRERYCCGDWRSTFVRST